MDDRSSNRKPRIVVIGAGFGGINAVQEFQRLDADVLLIDRRNYHLFQPLLYQVATAGLSPSDISYPVRAIFRNQHNARFMMAEVNHIDLENQCLITSLGGIPYDFLIISVGSETNYFGLESVKQHGFELKDLDDAEGIRNHILRMFEVAAHEPDPEIRKALLTFVIVGGGPTGVECSGAFSELFRLVLSKDFPNIKFENIRVIILEMLDHLLPGFPSDLGRAAGETLQRKHVEVRLGETLEDFDGENVRLKSGEIIPTRTVVWAAGVKAAQLANTLGVPMARQGRVLVSASLQLPDYPEVFVIGDAAYLEHGGDPLPMVAPVAIQQARTAARNIQKIIAGQPVDEFVYKDPGSLATIGRNAAVARVGRFKFKGFLAWLVWLAVHIFWLIGFRNRLLVLINWGWDYFLFERAVRLITPTPERAKEVVK